MKPELISYIFGMFIWFYRFDLGLNKTPLYEFGLMVAVSTIVFLSFLY